MTPFWSLLEFNGVATASGKWICLRLTGELVAGLLADWSTKVCCHSWPHTYEIFIVTLSWVSANILLPERSISWTWLGLRLSLIFRIDSACWKLSFVRVWYNKTERAKHPRIKTLVCWYKCDELERVIISSGECYMKWQCCFCLSLFRALACISFVSALSHQLS